MTKQELRKYLNHPGIYAIINLINGKMYVGSSVDMEYRWFSRHLNHLQKNKHENQHLQSSWNKYGEENFEIIILEKCDRSKFKEREEYFMNFYFSWDRQYGYNKDRIVNENIERSEETRIKTIETKREKILERISNSSEKIDELRKQNKTWSEIAIEVNICFMTLAKFGVVAKYPKLNTRIKFIIAKEQEDESTTKNYLRKLKNIPKEHKTNHEIIKNLVIQNKSRKEILEITKLDNSTIGNHLRDLKENFQSSLPTIYLSSYQKNYQTIRDLMNEGKSKDEIQAITNLHITTVKKHYDAIQKEMGIYYKPKINYKITSEDKIKILELDYEGIHYMEIAKIFNVDEATIRYHLRNIKNIKQGKNSTEEFEENQETIKNLILEGKSRKEIYEILDLDKGTIKKHFRFLEKNYGISQPSFKIGPARKDKSIVENLIDQGKSKQEIKAITNFHPETIAKYFRKIKKQESKNQSQQQEPENQTGDT